MVHMASLGAFDGRVGKGFFVCPEKEATELDFLLENKFVALVQQKIRGGRCLKQHDSTASVVCNSSNSSSTSR